MSWEVYLEDPKTRATLKVSGHQAGGIQQARINPKTHWLEAIDSIDAWINVTWNYGWHFTETLGLEDGFTGLHGKTAEDTRLILAKAIALLTIMPNVSRNSLPPSDHWAATPKNARKILEIMLSWAQEYPEGIWEIH